MATVEQLSQALKNAHAAGDTAAAQKLAQALQSQGSFQTPTSFPTPELGLVDTFTGGVSRGLDRLGSTFTDVIPAIAASAVGADEYAQEQLAEAAEKQALSQRLNPTQFESFKDVEGVGDFTRFAAETIGEQFGNLGLTLGAALTGGALAPVAGAARATGQLAGAAFGSYALNAPEVFENVYRETGETAPGTALLFGAAAASLDSILPLALTRNISGPMKAGIATKLLEKSGMSRGVLRSGTAGLFSGLGLEGITEGAQEGISIAAERFIDDNPDVFGSKEFDRIMEASVRGAVAGGGFGTVGGTIEGAREGSQRAQRLADLEEAKKLRKKTNDRYAAPEGTIGGQRELPFVDPVKPDQSPQERRTNLNQAQEFEEIRTAQEDVDLASQSEEIDSTVVSMPFALETARRRKTEGVPLTGEIKDLTPEQLEVVEQIRKEESQRILYEDAAVEAQRLGVEFDATKPFNQLTNAEKEIIETVGETRKSRFSKEQGSLFANKVSEDGTLGPSTAAKKTERAEAKKVKAEAAAKKAATKQLLGAEQGQFTFGLTPEEQATQNKAQQKIKEDQNKQAVEQEAANIVDARFEGELPPSNRDQLIADEIAIINRRSSEGQADLFSFEEATEKSSNENEIIIDNKQQLAEAEPIVGVAAELSEEQQAQNLIDNTEKEYKDALIKSIRTQKIDAGRIETAEITNKEQAAIAEKSIERDLLSDAELFTANNNGSIGYSLTKLLRAYNGFYTGANTGTPNRKAARMLEPKIKEIAKNLKQPATKLLSLAKRKNDETFNQYLNNVNKETQANFNETFRKEILPKYVRLYNKPTYKGKPFDSQQMRIAEQGNFKQLLNRLIPSQAPEIQRVLRKIRSQGLTTKLVVQDVSNIPEATSSSGYYDVDTNTIVLNSRQGELSGLTEETFLHETIHAAISQALNNPDLQITKDFFKFYSDIKNQMGDAYGGQDLQEFAAELVSNPEFQALLRSTKAPNAAPSNNLLTNIFEAIARFFGFRPQQSAYTKGLDFIDKILDVSQGVEPTLSGRLFLSTPSEAMGAMSDALTKTPKFVGKKANDVANAVSNLVGQEGGGTIASNALRAFRIQDFIRMTEKKYPDLAAKLTNLREALLKREGEKEKNLKTATDKYRKNERVQKKYPQAAERMGVMADIAHRNQFDLTGKVDPEFDINVMVKDSDGNNIFNTLPEQKAAYNKLQAEFNRLPAEVREMYTEMRQDFKDTYTQFREYIKKLAPSSEQKRITDPFARTQPAIGYFPAVRFGDYWLRYTNSSGRDVTTAFESERQRRKFITDNNIENAEVFNKVENAEYKADTFPEGSFIREVMKVVPAENQKDVYGILLDIMPSNSFDQRLRLYTGKEGASTDLVKVHGDTYLKVLRKINTMKYMPDIQDAINSITSTESTGFPAAIRDEIQRRGNTGFMQSPSYPKMTTFFATGAYSLFLLGNASAALINTSSVLLLTYPRLAAQYGFEQANRVLLSAMKEAFPSLKKKGERELDNFTTYKWQNDPKYKTLYDGLMEKAQLEHTLARELLDGTKKDTSDFDSRTAKFMNMLSMPFSGAEKYSRATTAIATYNLAKANGKSDSAAVDEAVNQVIDVHTSGLAAEGPSLMQHPLGRVAFTFKSFIWNSASLVGYGIYEATAGSDKATRLQAQKQVALIYTMSAAMGGINGLPFFGAAATFANIMEALSSVFDDEEDEPFNFKEFVRSSTNDLVYKGPLNYITNLEISNRVGLANGLVFREDPYSIERNGYLATAAAQSVGPVGSYFLNAGRAFEYLGEGDYRRFSEALSPSALRNLIKTTRYMDEGARTRSGEELDTDINAYSLLMQAFGFSPADISNMYENRSLALNFQTKVRNRRKALLKAHYMGIENNDPELQAESLERLLQLNELFPGILKENTLTASYKSHQAYSQDLLLGLKFDAALRNTVTDRFLSDFVA